MGIRGEIFSTRLILPNRTYFLNVKENRMGDLYLNIVESKNKESGGFERQSVIIFSDDLPLFLGEFEKSLKMLEKAKREQKRPGRETQSGRAGQETPQNRGRRGHEEYSGGKETPQNRTRRSQGEYSGEKEPGRPGRRSGGFRQERPQRQEGKHERPHGKRVVVSVRGKFTE
jgi:hypothetical protein